MDVKKVFALAIICGVFSGCLPGEKSSNSTNKAFTDGDCASQAINGEKIVRWKNGKISRLVFKNTPDAFKKYVDKHKNEIDMVEDNFKIARPQKPLELLNLKSARTESVNWGMNAINAPALWSKNVLGEGVVVAIVDSGIDRNHTQLSSQLYINPSEVENGVDDDGNGLIDDINGYDFTHSSGALEDTTGHGTHVAGIIAASHSGPVKGIAPAAKILMYDFFGDEGQGTVFDSIQAVRMAARMGAKVINASWGGSTCSLSLKSVLIELSQQDIMFVTASGNDHWNIDLQPSYPAAFSTDTLISVGAMTSDELTAGFSNYGKKVNIVAPGVGIISTYPMDDYQSDDGTSMAAPFVTGAVALLRSAFPQARAVDVRRAILSSAKQGPYPVSSRGSLDVAAAYEVLQTQFNNSQLR